MLYFQRKKLKINLKELDLFIKSDTPSTKYYIEKHYLENKFFRYLLLLRIKGSDLNNLFDEIIKQNQDEINEIFEEINSINQKIDKIYKSKLEEATFK